MTVIGSVEFEASLSLDKFNQQLDRLIAKNKNLAIPIQVNLDTKQANKLKTNLPTLQVKVDDSALTRLNQHLELKRKHHREVQQYFNSNPLTIKTDDRELDRSIQKIRKLKNEIASFKQGFGGKPDSKIVIEHRSPLSPSGGSGGAVIQIAIARSSGVIATSIGRSSSAIQSSILAGSSAVRSQSSFNTIIISNRINKTNSLLETLEKRLPDAIGKSVRRFSKDGLIMSILKAPFKMAGGMVSGATGDVSRGFFEDIGKNISSGFGTGRGAKAASKKIDHYMKLTDEYLIGGVDNYMAAFLAELTRSGSFSKASAEAMPRLRVMTEYVPRFQKMMQVSGLLDAVKRGEDIPEDIVKLLLESTGKSGKKVFKSREDLQGAVATLKDNPKNAKANFRMALATFGDGGVLPKINPQDLIQGYVNPILKELSSIIGFIGKIQQNRAIIGAQKKLPGVSASLPKLGEGQEGYLQVIGGAVQRKGIGGGYKLETFLEPLAKERKILPVHNPDTDPAGNEESDPLLIAVLGLVKQIAPDIAGNEELYNTLLNGVVMAVQSINPMFQSQAVTDALANILAAQQQGVDPEKISTVSYSLGGKEARALADALRILGINSKTLAMAYPEINASQTDVPNFVATQIEADALGFVKNVLKIGGDQNMAVYTPDVSPSPEAHAPKHYFKDEKQIADFFDFLGIKPPDVSSAKAISTYLTMVENFTEQLTNYYQAISLQKTGKLNPKKVAEGIGTPKNFQVRARNVVTDTLEATYRNQLFEQLEETLGVNASPEMIAIARKMRELQSQGYDALEAKLVEFGFSQPKKETRKGRAAELFGQIKLRDEVHANYLPFLDAVETGVPNNNWFVGGLDPSEMLRKSVDAAKGAAWFKTDGKLPDENYTEAIVGVFDNMRKIAVAYHKSGGKLTPEIKEMITEARKLPLLETVVDPMPDEFNEWFRQVIKAEDIIPRNAQKEFTVPVPEWMNKTPASAIAYNQMIADVGSQGYVPPLKEIQTVAYGMSGATSFIGKDHVYKNEPGNPQAVASKREIEAYQKLAGRYSPLMYAAEEGKAMVVERVKGRPVKSILDELAEPAKKSQLKLAELEKQLKSESDPVKQKNILKQIEEETKNFRKHKRTFNEEAVKIYTKIGQLGKTMAEMGVVHGDLASSNVFQMEDGSFTSIDLGNSIPNPTSSDKFNDQMTTIQRAVIDSHFWGILDVVKIPQAIMKGYKSKSLPPQEERFGSVEDLPKYETPSPVPLGSGQQGLLEDYLGYEDLAKEIRANLPDNIIQAQKQFVKNLKNLKPDLPPEELSAWEEMVGKLPDPEPKRVAKKQHQPPEYSPLSTAEEEDPLKAELRRMLNQVKKIEVVNPDAAQQLKKAQQNLQQNIKLSAKEIDSIAHDLKTYFKSETLQDALKSLGQNPIGKDAEDYAKQLSEIAGVDAISLAYRSKGQEGLTAKGKSKESSLSKERLLEEQGYKILKGLYKKLNTQLKEKEKELGTSIFLMVSGTGGDENKSLARVNEKAREVFATVEEAITELEVIKEQFNIPQSIGQNISGMMSAIKSYEDKAKAAAAQFLSGEVELEDIELPQLALPELKIPESSTETSSPDLSLVPRQIAVTDDSDSGQKMLGIGALGAGLFGSQGLGLGAISPIAIPVTLTLAGGAGAITLSRLIRPVLERKAPELANLLYLDIGASLGGLGKKAAERIKKIGDNVLDIFSFKTPKSNPSPAPTFGDGKAPKPVPVPPLPPHPSSLPPKPSSLPKPVPVPPLPPHPSSLPKPSPAPTFGDGKAPKSVPVPPLPPHPSSLPKATPAPTFGEFIGKAPKSVPVPPLPPHPSSLPKATPAPISVTLTSAGGAGAITLSRLIRPVLERKAPELANLLYLDIGASLGGLGKKAAERIKKIGDNVLDIFSFKTPKSNPIPTPTFGEFIGEVPKPVPTPPLPPKPSSLPKPVPTPPLPPKPTPAPTFGELIGEVPKPDPEFENFLEEALKNLILLANPLPPKPSSLPKPVPTPPLPPKPIPAPTFGELIGEVPKPVPTPPLPPKPSSLPKPVPAPTFGELIGEVPKPVPTPPLPPKPSSLPKPTPAPTFGEFIGEGSSNSNSTSVEGFDRIQQAAISTTRTVKKEYSTLKGIIDELTSWIPEPLKPLFTSLSNLKTTILNLGIFGFIQGQLRSIASTTFEVTARFTVLENTINFLSGGMKQGAKQMAFLRGEIERTSSALEPALQSYKKLAASTRNTSMEGKQTNQFASAIMQAGTVFGLTGEELEGSILAISQIAGKGVVSMEELRGQLAERIPGAFQIAARSMNVAEQELFKLISTGKLAASDFLPKFLARLDIETAGGVEDAANTTRAALTRLQNGITEIQVVAGKQFQGAMVVGMDLLSSSLKIVTKHAGTFVQIIQIAAGVALTYAAPAMFALAKSLIAVPMASTIASVAVNGLGDALKLLIPSVAGFAVKTALIWAAIEAFKILYDTFSTFTSKTTSQTWADILSKNLQKSRKDVEDLRKELDKINKTNAPKSPGQRFKTELDYAIEKIRTERSGEGWGAKANRFLNPFENSPILAWMNPLKGNTVEQDKEIREALKQAVKDKREVEFLQKDRKSGVFKELTNYVNSSMVEGNIKKIKELNAEIETLRQKSTLTKDPATQKQLKDQLETIRAQRNILGSPLTDSLKFVTVEIENRNKRIKETNDDKLRVELQNDIVILEKLKNKLLEVERQTGAQTTLSELIQVLSGLRTEMEVFNRVAAELADKNLSKIANTELKNLKTNVFASPEANLQRTANSLELVRNKINISQETIKELKQLLADPLMSQYVTSYKDKSLEQLRSDLEGVDEADTQRRKALEALISLREQESELIALNREQLEATLNLEKEKSQFILAQLDRYKANIQARSQIEESTLNNNIAQGQLKGTINPESVERMKTEVSLKASKRDQEIAKIDLETLKKHYKEGKISAEDFANRRRDLEVELGRFTQQVSEQQLQLRQARQQEILDILERQNQKLGHQLKLQDAIAQINQKSAQITRETMGTQEELSILGQLRGNDTRTRSGEDAQARLSRQREDLKLGLSRATEDETLAIQRQTSERYKAELERSLSELKNHYQQKLISKREFEDSSRQIEQELSSTNVQLKDYELQAAQRLNQRQVEDFERTNQRIAEDRERLYDRMGKDFDRAVKKQENALQLSAIQQEQKIRSRQFNQSGIIGSQRAEQEAAIALTKVQEEQLKKQLKATLEQIEAIAKLKKENALTAWEAEDRTADLTIKAEQLRLDLINKQIDKTKQLKDIKLLALDTELTNINSIFQRQEMGYTYELEQRKLIVSSLEQEKSLLDGQLRLQQALAKGEEDRGQAALDRSKQNEDLLGRLADVQKQMQSGELDYQKFKGSQYLSRLIQEITGKGVGNTYMSESSIRDARTEQYNKSAITEQKLLEMKTRHLEKQQQLQLIQNELQQRMNRLTAENNIMEANISLNKARQAELQAKIALDKARTTGDANEIKNAQDSYDLARQNTLLSGKQLQNTIERLSATQQLSNLDTQALQAEQANERSNLGEANRKAIQDLALRGGELASQGAINPDSMIQIDPTGIRYGLEPMIPLLDLTSQIGTKIDALVAGIEKLNNRPTGSSVENLTIVSSDPTGDSRQVLDEMTRARNMYY